MLGYFITYLLGIATPIIIKVLILPKLKRKIKKKVEKW